ncbi:MAG: 50S ribosomal protein L18Ae [Candidatus Methanomethylophilaceae archaeon]|nr:50S ribosomal protein L18Ae [Candidatus Methanomethylophilaceae archaeon]MDD3378751.1 50S ribosomal protein L18Ae [Candidatus Methanomethylophilaceae archaeon]MDY0223780.1 50S ribosomal protein L18Ae [Candidatus Methanomethylophilaceae archaeon]
MKAFRVIGSMADPRKRQPFSIEMSAEDEAAVREKTLSTLGSKHKLKRQQIEITSVTEISVDQIESHVIKYNVSQ